MHATRAAVEEGILPGGGGALLRAVESLKRVKTANEDQKHGVEIVKKAITWPTRQIVINSGEDGSVVVGKILENDTYAYGFDAQSGEFGNLVSKGIIDPTKVVRIALQDGASIAGLLITPKRWSLRAALQRELPARAAVGTMGGGPTYVGEELECLPAKSERAIACMRLIAGRTKFAHSLALSLQ